MNSLLGLDLPTGVNFIIAFVVVLALIGAATWLIRRFGVVTKLDANSRGRQPRLAVTDTAAIDGRRKLVIVRRDNVEHLLMIGGPNDVVVESAIVRGPAALQMRAGAIPDPLPRTVALPDATSWPLQPEPAPLALTRVERDRDRARLITEENPQWPEPPIVPATESAPERARAAPTRDPLAGLAAELAKPVEQPPAPPPRQKPAARPAPSVVATAAPPAPHPAPPPPPAPPLEISAAADKNLAEMAKRLEAALRQPGATMPHPDTRPAKLVVPELKRIDAKPPSRPDLKPVESTSSEPWPGEVKLAEAKLNESKPADHGAPAPGGDAAAPKGPDLLEQEMASLLGRTAKS